MQIILVGLNHETAPVAIREQFALARCGLRMALEDLRPIRSPNGNGRFQVSRRVAEVVILST
jgi:glutamyl-tRNA reductase